MTTTVDTTILANPYISFSGERRKTPIFWRGPQNSQNNIIGCLAVLSSPKPPSSMAVLVPHLFTKQSAHFPPPNCQTASTAFSKASNRLLLHCPSLPRCHTSARMVWPLQLTSIRAFPSHLPSHSGLLWSRLPMLESAPTTFFARHIH